MKKGHLNYRKEGEAYLIELQLRSLQQLFNSLDPAPFRDRDLAPAAEEYIVDAAAEFSLPVALKLRLHLAADSLDQQAAAGIPAAIQNYFAYRAEVTARQFRRVLSQARLALLVGVGFLFTCILIHHAIATLGRDGLFWAVLQEGFLITGWVAMWHPINLFLYEWWPIQRRQRLYQKLAQTPVELLTGDTP